MQRKMAEALATALGGEFVEHSPTDRLPGVNLTLADGFASIEGDSTGWGAAWRFPSRASYDRYHADGFQGTVPDAADWEQWGSQQWADSLASILGGQAHHAGGNCRVVLWTRPDGRFVCIGEESACLMTDRSVWDRMDPSDDDGTEHFDYC